METSGGPALDSRAPGADGFVALEELYRAFFVRLVRRACWRYGLSKEDASEVVHDAFVLALVKLNTEGNPRAWIYSVVDRMAANWRRKSVRRSLLMEKWHSTEISAQPGRAGVDGSEDSE